MQWKHEKVSRNWALKTCSKKIRDNVDVFPERRNILTASVWLRCIGSGCISCWWYEVLSFWYVTTESLWFHQSAIPCVLITLIGWFTLITSTKYASQDSFLCIKKLDCVYSRRGLIADFAQETRWKWNHFDSYIMCNTDLLSLTRISAKFKSFVSTPCFLDIHVQVCWWLNTNYH